MKANEDSTPALEDPRVVAALDEYLAALEAGAPIDRAQFLARHSELAASLVQCLDGMEFLHRASSARDTDGALARSEEAWTPGTVLGDFRIVQEMGRGGMGVVYEARQVSLDRRVALKVLPLAGAASEKRLQRFKNEAHTTARLHHPNIVPVYAIGADRGVHFFAMQFIEGQSLSELIAELHRSGSSESLMEPPSTSARGSAPRVVEHDATGPADSSVRANGAPSRAPVTQTIAALAAERTRNRLEFYRRIAALGRTVAEALEHAHQVGVVHRDIKPGNLMLDAHDNLWITDFGLATIQSEPGLTQSGELLGTLRYMSPEQALAKPGLIDHRTDIYSLGATLYELLTLAPVFDGRDRFDLLQHMAVGELKPLRKIEPAIPVELETIVLKSLSHNAQDRYASSQAMADDLHRFLNNEPILARPPSLLDRARRWTRRHPSFMAVAAALLVFGVIALGAGAALIAREHANTQLAYQAANQAYRAEQNRANEAEERFQMARRSADEMIRIAEQELTSDPQQIQVRQRLLEAALDYYQEFVKLRQGNPAAQAELDATRVHIQRILEDLAIIRGGERHMLLSHPAVQEDLRISTTQRSSLQPIFREIDSSNPGPVPDIARTNDERSKKRLDEMKAHEAQIGAILTREQLARLQQIVLQLHGAHAFREPEVVAALKLTPEQREQLRTIGVHGRPGHPPPPSGMAFPDHGGPPDRGRPGGPGPRPADGREGGFPPAPGLLRRLGDPGFQMELTRALNVLTGEQKARWQELVGEPLRVRLGPPQEPDRPPQD